MSSNVGFDFDECLAQGYSIMPIILFLERYLKKEPQSPEVAALIKVAKGVFYNRVAANEIETKGTILRPSMLEIIPGLLKKRKEGKIGSLFIYSNNISTDLIDAVDHILALTLLKMKKVDETDLIQEIKDNRLHVMTPRINRNASCRSSEQEVKGFREKTFEGIQTCLGKAISEKDLWFLDDTKDHIGLIQKLKGNYIETKKYEVRLNNWSVAELVIRSFPKEAFNPKTELGRVFLKAYGKLESHFIVSQPGELYLKKKNPRFNPKGGETEEDLLKLLQASLAAISPNASGAQKKNWTKATIDEDVSKISKGLENALIVQPYQTADKTLDLATATAYSETIGGGNHLRRRRLKKPTSRSKRYRVARTRRKNRA
jgi:hypothetical protein